MLPIKDTITAVVTLLLSAGLIAFSQSAMVKSDRLSEEGFRVLMNTVAEGWNSGNARKAADCYTIDAKYTEPPDKQVHIGREALFEFFGGGKKTDPPMRMEWHHLAFDEESQVGFGEYTFQMNNRYHGIVVVKLRRARLATGVSISTSLNCLGANSPS
jgi:hypothetical protein